MKIHAFCHANLRDEKNMPTLVFVALHQIYSFYFSETHRCTHIVSTGGAIIPILEGTSVVEQILKETPDHGRKDERPSH